MLYSKYHKKKTYEDQKTSSVFETMLMLPDELFWSLLRCACFNNDNLPIFAGQIVDYEFWPHWDPTGTTNSTLVEPDIFIRFQSLDLIIEAKYSDSKGQYSEQWENEVIAYKNEYGNDKPVYFMAVGGNAEKASEIVPLVKDVVANKCTWLSLLIQVTKLRDEYDALTMSCNSQSTLIRLLNLIELAFNIHEVYNIHWFNEIGTEEPLISTDSIMIFKTYFK